LTEADFKREFKKSVRHHGGFATSLPATTISSGIPDLYVCVPDFKPILLEAKLFREMHSPKFRRKIPYSALQKVFLQDLNKVQRDAGFGLVGFTLNKITYAVLVPIEYDHLDGNFMQYCAYCTKERGEKYFNIPQLFSMLRGAKGPLHSVYTEVPSINAVYDCT